MLTAAQQRVQLIALGLAQLDSVPYIHRCPPKLEGTTDESDAGHLSHAFHTPLHVQAGPVPRLHPRLHPGARPAEADLQRHFHVTPPSVHQMVLTLERAGLIRRTPGAARSIEVLVEPHALPPLQPSGEQIVKSSVQRY